MQAVPEREMTVSDFLAWAQAQPSGRYELLDGKVIAMSPERASHVRIKLSMVNALRGAIDNARLQCEAFTDGLSVAVDDKVSFEPDALVNCGEPIAGDRITAPNPVIVVEVLSPGTQSIDKTRKLSEYFRVPSLHHYIVLDGPKRLIVHHRRWEEGKILTSLIRAGRLDLDPPGISVDFAAVFGAAEN